MDAFHLVAAIRRDAGQAVADGDPADHQDVILIKDVPNRLYLVSIGLDFDLTRLQRAGERAGQSPAGGRHDIVKCRRVRREVRWRDAVVLGHLGVHAEGDRLVLGGQVGQALRAAEPLDTYARNICRSVHTEKRSGSGGDRFEDLLGRSLVQTLRTTVLVSSDPETA